MARKTEFTSADAALLAFYLEETVTHVVSMVVDHSADCPVHAAAVRLMELAHWTDEDLARVIVQGMSL
jgi:hypothetical protein